ncbi:hypothetical protein WJX81_007218 [Elliptochloris bilobata]|uniref:Beta-galactosidase n=1 Tax=Elliptochloris bilobata TaxID=381761 RepID=A0AAW1QTY5_9CHLO
MALLWLNLVILCVANLALTFCATPSFTICQDKFLKDGRPFQVMSGSFHYWRIHPRYWEDRLHRAISLGLNTIQTYVPWALHEPHPGKFTWSGHADVCAFLEVAHSLNLSVVLRPGPFIAAEFDFGGLPAWLASPEVAGGGEMRLRSSDPRFLSLVDTWWRQLLPRLAPFTHSRGGPIILVQIENEYGYCGSDKAYLRHLLASARQQLGGNVILFTTDPPDIAHLGSLPGAEVLTVVDFGPGSDVAAAFAAQRLLNSPGYSPPFCSEFYTGWITHWSEAMANTSTVDIAAGLQQILDYGAGSGSVNLYMAHGGSSWGFWSGSGGSASNFMAQITSYDYSAPISEAGGVGQPGIGGANKFEAVRSVIAAHTGRTPPPLAPQPPAAAYGWLALSQRVALLDALHVLAPGDGIPADVPERMEAYSQLHGVIAYKTQLPASASCAGGLLDLGESVRDYAQVYVNGRLVGTMEHGKARTLHLPPSCPAASAGLPAVNGSNVGPCSRGTRAELLVLVHAMGRNSAGCDWDFKGLIGRRVAFDGVELRGWRVFPLGLESVAAVPFGSEKPRRRQRSSTLRAGLIRVHEGRACWHLNGPVFHRGVLHLEDIRGGVDRGHPADTFLAMHGWGKGLLWVNGFNLGWYWPAAGPQMTTYMPGPLLRWGDNEVVLLEFLCARPDLTVRFVDTPDFHGPP